MNLFGKDLNHEVAIIAEIGVNHEGSVDAASRMMKMAADAGADAVKFQSYTPERYISADDSERLARVGRFGIDEAAHRRLAKEADALGIAFFSSAISEDVIPLLAELCPVIKIASGDIDFEPVIRAASATGKPVILSTGTATIEEVDRAVGWVRDEVGAEVLREHLALMHCVSAYPAPFEEANLLSIPVLAERYQLHTGYSNHVIGREAVICAIGLGAEVVEVHFTDQKDGRSFRDHQLSFDAEDLAYIAQISATVRASRGTPTVDRQPSEIESVAAMRKGIVASRDLKSGTILSREDLMFARPAHEFTSGEIGSLIGKRLVSEYRSGETIRRESVEL